jgi:hypothetical protein
MEIEHTFAVSQTVNISINGRGRRGQLVVSSETLQVYIPELERTAGNRVTGVKRVVQVTKRASKQMRPSEGIVWMSGLDEC